MVCAGGRERTTASGGSTCSLVMLSCYTLKTLLHPLLQAVHLAWTPSPASSVYLRLFFRVSFCYRCGFWRDTTALVEHVGGVETSVLTPHIYQTPLFQSNTSRTVLARKYMPTWANTYHTRRMIPQMLSAVLIRPLVAADPFIADPCYESKNKQESTWLEGVHLAAFKVSRSVADSSADAHGFARAHRACTDRAYSIYQSNQTSLHQLAVRQPKKLE